MVEEREWEENGSGACIERDWVKKGRHNNEVKDGRSEVPTNIAMARSFLNTNKHKNLQLP